MKILLKAALTLAASAMPYVHVQAEPAMRQVPARELPAPDTVSPEDRALIGAPLSPIWNVHPTSADEWKEFVAKVAARAIAGMPELLAKLNVKREQRSMH
jgi:monoterpene epsilon-lactone hydrolase